MPELLFDTHAHYYDKKFEGLPGGADAILRSDAFRETVGRVINVGTNPETNKKCIAQAAEYDFMYAAVGIHPEDAHDLDGEPSTYVAELEGLIGSDEDRRRNKIVAIGEIGLDYHWYPEDREKQLEFLTLQIELAGKLDLPVIIHDREAHGDCFDTVLKYPAVRGVFHCYSGSAQMATEPTRRGWYVAFGGALTYNNAKRATEAAAAIPADRLLIETDCPYMAPVPHRGEVNHSGLMKLTAERLAGIRGLSYAELARLTKDNAARLFGISNS